MNMEKIKFFLLELKEKISTYISKLNITSKDIINYSVIFGIFFILGMILKKFFKYIIIFTIIFIIIACVLEYYKFFNLNTPKIHSILNIENLFSKNTNTLEIISKSIMNTIQKNIIEISISSLAFVLGFKSI